MLSIFRSQQPISFIVFTIFYIVFKSIIYFINITPIAEVDNIWLHLGSFELSIKLINFALANLLIYLQCLWFNILFHKANFNDSNTVIPALYYCIITAIFPMFNFLNIYIILTFLLLLLFYFSIKLNNIENSKIDIFNVGLIVGILICFHHKFILFIPFIFIIINVLRAYNFKDTFLLFTGIITPIYILFSFNYLFDFYSHWKSILPNNFYLFIFDNNLYFNILLATVGIYLLISFFSVSGILFSAGFKRKKSIKTIAFMLLGLLICTIFSNNQDNNILCILFIPIGIFLSLMMLRIHKKQWTEILNAIFILAIFVINILRIFE